MERVNKKSTIGILTYHTGFNYGASLQAFALMTSIKKMGYSCEIINFETERFVASREMFSRNPRRLKEFIKIGTRIPYYAPLKKRQRLFEEFTQNALSVSALYRTEQEVIAHATDYDCIVCGSDQIWNLSQEDAPAANLIFYLNFTKQQRRISYAASFGKWVKEASQMEEQFLPWLKLFDAISVRESSGVEFVQSRGLDCALTLDPTVLLDREDYDVICAERQISEPYVLLFSWACGSEVVKTARRVAKEKKLPLLSLTPPPRTIGSGIKRKLDVGPSEFLSMIRYADFVVTDSFHGTAFSTIYERPYISVVSNGKADPRMESLLNQLELQNHLSDALSFDTASILQTDFTKVREKKRILRESSLDFLEKALSGLEREL